MKDFILVYENPGQGRVRDMNTPRGNDLRAKRINSDTAADAVRNAIGLPNNTPILVIEESQMRKLMRRFVTEIVDVDDPF